MSDVTAVGPLGLALSGGTLKAAAHVGILQGLHLLGIRPDRVAGTSAGSLVAVLYAHGRGPDEMIQVIRRFPGPFLLDYGFPLATTLAALWSRWCHPSRPLRLPGGLLRGRRLERYVRGLIGSRRPVMPYYILATDLFSGRPVALTNDPRAKALGFCPVDDPALAVRSSCALPGIFTPVPLGDTLLTDGGIRDYVPVQVLRRAGCRRVIAVNLHRLDAHWRPDTPAHVIARALEILLHESVTADTAGDDVITLTPRLPPMTWWSFDQLMQCVRAGRLCVAENRDRLIAWLNRAQP
ncbi:patatin-like phospholipase family protein [Alicyclobacillus sp.]|uniref:patatin-like phospholipase family protein n=1 Tax=Alicyclobacillus sp. TaxID=61169 RepID=UPI0025BCAFF6|nr:patatin-like phospholipase family protein [Alicyclobacillus sp.]MCL6515569.1 patatin-like phospholipase family protein [Alicyclobacillus sp.]